MYRILLVEDNPLNQKLAALILSSAGYEVARASDSIEAERAIDDRVPDLILMDLGLPGKDGYALTREIRMRPSTRSVPVVALTSFAMKGDREKAMMAGCTDYLTKPIDRADLLEKVRVLLAAPPGPRGSTAPGGAPPSPASRGLA